MASGVEGEENFLELLDMRSQCTVILKPVDEVLTRCTVRLGGCGGEMVDGIKRKFGLKLQYDILCEVIGFTLPKYPFQRWKVWVEINDK